MGQKLEVMDPPHILKFVGIFDYDGLYKLITNWFIDYGYLMEEGTWKHKVPTPDGAEQEVDFSGWKKINEYIRYWVSVYFKVMDLKDVNIVQDGVKKTMQTGQFTIEFRGQVEKDFPGVVNSKFGEFLQDFWDKYLLKKDMDSVWSDQLYYIVYKLHTDIKEFIGMETSTDPFKNVW